MNRDKEVLLAAVDVACDTTDYLDGLTMASVAAKALSRITTDLVAHARSEGASWADVGAALGGISRQAAQQRFG